MSSLSDSETGDEVQAGQARGLGMGSFLGLWLPLLLLGYCLSIGPAARLHRSTPAARTAIEAFYKPLTVILDRCPRIRNIFQWYITAVWKVP